MHQEGGLLNRGFLCCCWSIEQRPREQNEFMGANEGRVPGEPKGGTLAVPCVRGMPAYGTFKPENRALMEGLLVVQEKALDR